MTATALSAGLIAAVACAMASLERAVRQRVEQTVGAADVRVRHVGGKGFDAEVVRVVEGWDEAAVVVARGQEPGAMRNPRTGERRVLVVHGIEPEREEKIRPLKVVEGKRLGTTVGTSARFEDGVKEAGGAEEGGEGEIALDVQAAEDLGARVGDVLEVEKFGPAVRVRVVGIVQRGALGVMSRPEGFVTLATLGRIADNAGRVREIDVVLKEGRNAAEVAAARQAEFAGHAGRESGTGVGASGLLVQATEKVTSGLEKNLAGNRIGLLVASVLTFLSSAFIILTGLTTNVTERQRELAVLRSVGATRGQLAWAQVFVGGIVGGLGGLIGAPVGVAMAWVLVSAFPEELPGGFAVHDLGVGLAVAGALAAGLAGALWPAVAASRATPLEGLASRARRVSRKSVALATVAGVFCVMGQAVVIGVPTERDVVFWGHVTVGLPLLVTGYFLLGVAAVLVVTWGLGGVVSKVLGLPAKMLERTVRATPFRHGFTAGAMMVGLALMVAIWTNGRAVLRDWLDNLAFPDAFVSGLNMDERTRERVEALAFVRGTCALTLQSVETEAFGISGVSRYKTSFVAFEPERFFQMVKLTWVEPADEKGQDEAKAALARGGALLVAREFKTAKGIGAGDTLTLGFNGARHEFRVVGVVTSPGLDIASKFFDIGEEYIEQSVNAVFGTRADLKEKFGNDAINLIQLQLDPSVDDEAAINEIKRIAGAGVLTAGSGRQIKAKIREFIGGSLYVFSVVAVASMVVACFGVANLIVAGVQARRFEFGVLRAVGAPRGLLTRLVLGEALLIGLAACVVGTLMGTQAAWAGQRLYEVVIGLDLRLRPPVVAIAVAWVVVTGITVLAAVPTGMALLRRKPRELLASVKG